MELEPLEMEVLLAIAMKTKTAADLAVLLVRCEGCGGFLPMTDACPIVFQGRRFRFTGWTCDRWCAETAGAVLTLKQRLPIDGGPWRVMSATVVPEPGPAKPTP